MILIVLGWSSELALVDIRIFYVLSFNCGAVLIYRCRILGCVALERRHEPITAYEYCFM